MRMRVIVIFHTTDFPRETIAGALVIIGMAAGRDGVLKTDDLLKIQEELWDARSKWRNIGLGLKIRASHLRVIDQNGDNVDDKFQSMILRWLHIGKDCTWGALCEVLLARSVGHSHLAEQIRRNKVACTPHPYPDTRYSDCDSDPHRDALPPPAPFSVSVNDCSITSQTASRQAIQIEMKPNP